MQTEKRPESGPDRPRRIRSALGSPCPKKRPVTSTATSAGSNSIPASSTRPPTPAILCSNASTSFPSSAATSTTSAWSASPGSPPGWPRATTASARISATNPNSSWPSSKGRSAARSAASTIICMTRSCPNSNAIPSSSPPGTASPPGRKTPRRRSWRPRSFPCSPPSGSIRSTPSPACPIWGWKCSSGWSPPAAASRNSPCSKSLR